MLEIPYTMESSELLFYVNGRRIIERNPDPDTTLVQYLRFSLGLTGTKLACGVGGCGACTVMVSWFEQRSGIVRHAAVNACLARLCSLHGRAVTTVEGVGSTRGRLHPVQERIASSHGSQCGFCTPGMVMSMYALLRNEPHNGGTGGMDGGPTTAQLEAALAGNLCRCTGYRPILEAFRGFTKEGREEKKLDVRVNSVSRNIAGAASNMNDLHCGDSLEPSTSDVSTFADMITEMGRPKFSDCKKMTDHAQCCTMGGKCCMKFSNADESGHEKVKSFEMPYNPETQEAIFPCELQLRADELESKFLTFRSDRTVWYRPTNLATVLSLMKRHPAARLIASNTAIGVEIESGSTHDSVLIAVMHVSEMKAYSVTDEGLIIGGSVTCTEIEDILTQVIKKLPEEKTRFFTAISEMLRLVGSQQIRNVASVGGHIVNASAVSDLNPIFQATNCSVTVVSSQDGMRVIKMDNEFFTGPGTTIISKTEVLMSITIPFSTENTYIYATKPMMSDDVTKVTSNMVVKFQDGGHLIENVALSFGGMALTTMMSVNTARELQGMFWNEEMLARGTKLLTEELRLKPNTPESMIEYLILLIRALFYKFYLTIRLILEHKHPHLYSTPTPVARKSAVSKIHRPPSKGVQLYEQVDDQQVKVDAVGRPLPHLSSQLHATGEAVYVDDIKPFSNELHLALVISTTAHARILSIDQSEALCMDGVVDFITCRDVPGKNINGVIAQDEEIFRTEFVTCEGQVIGAVLADTRANAVMAARKIKIEYEELEAILTIEDAINVKSFLEMPERKIVNGNVSDGMASSDHIIQETFSIGGQKHFYMETHSCIAVPKGENGEMDIFSATQSGAYIQSTVAQALNVDANKIACHVKRLGGGFGGKETHSTRVALPAAVAAHKHQQPVRCVLDREQDTIISGGRHPFMAKYKIGFDKNGKILAVEVDLYSNGGFSADLSQAVLQEAMLHIDNSYKIPNVLIVGHVCKTNLASNTGFRGFGAPQATLICENWMTEIAKKLGVCPTAIRELNFYKEGDTTHYNQTLTNCTVKRCWEEVMRNSDYDRRKIKVDDFNRENRWRKRGIAVLPLQHGIGYSMFYDQGGALVNIYTDGSVLISHGGIEMGQGLHTKLIQIASRVFEIPVTKILISGTSTSVVPNATPTGGSHTSDLNGMAVLNACEVLKERLEPYRKAQPSAEWNDWVQQAYFDKISLSVTGFHRLTNLCYDWKTNTGERFNYFTFGAACSEVEIDCLTGEHVLLRSDIVMDVGKSLNPAIDIGQIEGGFVQGYGLFVVEQLKYTPEGLLRSTGPATYKIPTVSDIPIEFNVSLLKGASNPKAVYSSKGIGEPPLSLAASVFFALREAVQAARAEEGLGGQFSFHSPATAEAIRLAISNEAGYTYSV